MKRTALHLRIFLIVLAALMAVVPVIAFQVPNPTRFEDKVIQDPSASLSPAPVFAKDLSQGSALRPVWDAFRGEFGDKWDITVDSRSGVPLLVQGQGIPWIPGSGNSLQGSSAVTVDALDASLKNFVRAHTAQFAINADEMVLNRAGSGQMNADLWLVNYQRTVSGVPVSGDTLVFYIGHGNLISFGANRWGHITTSPVPSLPPKEAFAHLANYMGIGDHDMLTVLDSGSLLFTPMAGGGSTEESYTGPVGGGYDAALTYHISLRVGDEAPTWVALVDAHTGVIRALYDSNDYAQAKGGVLPLSNDGICPSGCEQPNYPMPYADITINGGAAPPANGAGIFNCTPTGGTAVTTLSGPFIKVVDTCGAVTRSSVCGADIDLGLNAGTDCAIPAGASPGDTRSSRTGFFHLNRIKEVARAFLPGNAWLNAQLTDNVNINLTCNAFWNGTSVNFYRSGGGCRNTGEISAVFLHEWGHGLDSNDGGGASNPGEAQADITSLMVTHSSCIGRGFFSNDSNCTGYGNACLSCSGIRDQDWDKRASHTASTPEGFIATCSSGGGPCGKEVHCEGYLVGETLFDLAVRDLPAAGLDANTAWQLANKLWYVSRLGSGGNMYGCGAPANTRSCAATTVMQGLRVTDDDNGNLADGTPHAAAIFAAFNRHNITCGAVGDAANQNSSSCPALVAPTVSTVAGSGAITLNWNAVAGASSYKILRNDAGCGAGYQIIATVAAPTTTYADNGLANGFTEYYSVQAVGANAACDGPMATCVTGTPQPCAGSVALSKQIVNCADSLGITVVDSDLVGNGAQNVAVSSTTEGTPETVSLTETPANSGIFTGSIATTTAAPTPNGVLSVANGDTVLVRYVDVSYCGTPNVPVDANASVDCVGPVITNVNASNITGNSATITWDTNEAASSSVTYGVAPGPPGTTPPPSATLVTSHSFPISGLTACTSYVYSVSSTDAAGNTATNSSGSNAFATGVNVTPTYNYSGPPVIIPDNNPTGATATLVVPDNKPIVDLNVTLTNIQHTYDGDIAIHIIGPDNTDVMLSNKRGGSGQNYVNTVFDDAAANPISGGTAPFTGTFKPDALLSAFNTKIAAGTWKLFIVDNAGVDSGTITSWSLNFTYPSQTCSCTVDSDCADGDLCNGVEHCVSTQCQPGTPVNCNDNDACTTDACTIATGACTHTAVTCNDSNPCTTDTCNPLSGCVFTNNTDPCPDSNLCNGNEVCGGGTCNAGTPVNCDDSLFCTIDGCTPATGACTHVTNNCSDGNGCTNDFCDEATDTCTHTTPGLTHICNTGNIIIPATGTGTSTGAPSNPYPSPIAVSGLGTSSSLCSVELKGLVHSFPGDIDVLLVGPAGGAQNAIIMSDVGGGDDVTGVNLQLQDGAPAMPLSLLTSGTYAPTNSGTGDAFPTPAPTPAGGSALSVFNGINPNGNWNLFVVDDAGADTGAFANGWCLNIIISSCTTDNDCSDSNPCNGAETCVTGQCVAGTPINCTDNDVCTTDACVPATGTCTHTAVVCNDNNTCTDDTCVSPSTGCTFTNNTSPCSDNNPCTSGDICGGGACIPGGPTNCNDNNDCTTDSCVNPTGCTHVPSSGGSCNDGNPCTTSDTCNLTGNCGENFDGVTAPALPAGWTVSGTGNLWATVTTSSDTAPNSVFVDDPATVTDKKLDSPVYPAGSTQVSFRNKWTLENTFDGGVLEISIAAGPFQDIIAAGGSFVTGGYTGLISTAFSSPIAGRNAWTGTQATFITTTVNLPPATTTQSFVLRFREATDVSVSSTGQNIDTITFTPGCGAICAGTCSGSCSLGEVSGVTFAADKTTLSWSSAALAQRYDALHGSVATLPVGPVGGDADEVCTDNISGTSTSAAAPVTPGSALWYLVRSENACAANGTWGYRAFGGVPGAERISATCP